MIKYTVDMEELSCTCPDSKFNGHRRMCKHAKTLVLSGVTHRDGNKFLVFKDDGRWYAGRYDKGFVGVTLAGVITAIGA